MAPARFAPHLIEEVYNLEDALVVAGFLNSFIRHADVVKVANLAQLVNVIAPILTRGDELLLQSIYDAFAMYSRRKGGTALRVHVEGPGYEGRTHGRVPYIDASAIRDGQELKLFLTNRSASESGRGGAAARGGRGRRAALGRAAHRPGPKAANSFEAPGQGARAGLRRRQGPLGRARAGRAAAALPGGLHPAPRVSSGAPWPEGSPGRACLG